MLAGIDSREAGQTPQTLRYARLGQEEPAKQADSRILAMLRSATRGASRTPQL